MSRFTLLCNVLSANLSSINTHLINYVYLKYHEKLPKNLKKTMLSSARARIIPTIIHSPKIKSVSFENRYD
ncbi:uncharacterized protein B0P05DRAFT_290632 [Gilbertella persicaria]|uniref:uncharacterized protein n=1 Tax=Gilbertella persicaria TaxID=101096 RepID=UPI00221E603C|nr:uncharacterized protein B0P05DRAFT_290632 [Gilbertella persicaria]KAI8054945.1 hypothetical protein B0P05DRAFT_290632 [Gilbertella persicaria]